jgi:hypothetical protein
MIQINKRYWEINYKENAPISAPVNSDEDIDAWLAEIQQTDGIIHDEFDEFVNGSQLEYRSWKDSNVFDWWAVSGAPGLRQ